MSYVTAPYSAEDIETRLLAAIAAAGLDADRGFDAEKLGMLDHFHTGGRRATIELFELANIDAAARVLDIGSGIGGSARLLASRAGCEVVCLEISDEFCRATRLLNRLTGLDERIEVRQGSAVSPPFDDASFDLVWMQNVGMNVADKAKLYAEVARVLRPGGRFALQEMAAGPAGDPYFPLPWANEGSESFLVTVEVLGELLEAAGFVRDEFEDSTDAELSQPPAGAAQGPLTVGVYIDDMATKSRNARRSLEDGRVRFVRGVCRKS